MKNLFIKHALDFLNENEPIWGIQIDRRKYLKDLIDHMADHKLAETLKEELASLSDEQLNLHNR